MVFDSDYYKLNKDLAELYDGCQTVRVKANKLKHLLEHIQRYKDEISITVKDGMPLLIENEYMLNTEENKNVQ